MTQPLHIGSGGRRNKFIRHSTTTNEHLTGSTAQKTSGRLAPVAVHKIPATALLNPSSRDPHSAGPRWSFPASWDPCVTRSVPPVVPGNPDISRRRSNQTCLGDWGGRTHAYIRPTGPTARNAGDGQAQQSHQLQSLKYFFHKNFRPFLR
jgi:hypothetical protein